MNHSCITVLDNALSVGRLVAWRATSWQYQFDGKRFNQFCEANSVEMEMDTEYDPALARPYEASWRIFIVERTSGKTTRISKIPKNTAIVVKVGDNFWFLTKNFLNVS